MRLLFLNILGQLKILKEVLRHLSQKAFPNGAKFAKVMFLDKSSSKSMNLNPYAQIILSGDFGEDWSKPFF